MWPPKHENRTGNNRSLVDRHIRRDVPDAEPMKKLAGDTVKKALGFMNEALPWLLLAALYLGVMLAARTGLN